MDANFTASLNVFAGLENDEHAKDDMDRVGITGFGRL